MANFYKQGTGYYTTDGKRVANPTALQSIAKSGGVEVIPGTNTPVVKKTQSSVERPGAYGASDWRGYQALKDASLEIIKMRNNQNSDINSAQTYWDTSFKDTTPFGGPKIAGSANASPYLDNKNFRELSPLDQASLIASKQGVSLANLQTIGDERAQRTKLAGTALDNVTRLYDLQQKAKNDEYDNLRQNEALNLSKFNSGLGYYDEKGVYRQGNAPTPLLETYLNSLGGFGTSQVYQDPVTYIKGRVIHGGYDILTPIGTPAKSPVVGKVVEIGKWNGKTGQAGGWGNYVVVKASDGSTFRLAHLDAPTVRVGDKVSEGGILGYTGNSGNSTGPHLHIEQKDSKGNLVDFGANTKINGGNKQTQTALIDLSSKTGVPVEELRLMSPTQLADLKSTLINKPASGAADVLNKFKGKETLIIRMGGKFGGEAGITLLFQKYLESPEDFRKYASLIKGVTEDDINTLEASFSDADPTQQ